MIHLSKEEIVMGFVATCVEEVAAKLDLDYLEVFEQMEQTHLIDDYIVRHYATLHAESRKAIVEDLIELLHQRLHQSPWIS
ncbi:MAG: DUF3791 domain-containing protein [Muribaculaceae bacterium]|nr:DUF3791 domain-containing protein [Muribaculaceae bacterium]